MEYLLFIFGMVLLIKAADYFVDSSINIAKILGIAEIIIGATIVSIGTTLPESIISIMSALKGHGDIAYGNAIGSIICNTSLISAISLIVAPTIIKRKDIKLLVSFFFTSFIFYICIAIIFKEFPRLVGFILISCFVLYAFLIILENRKESKIKDESKAIDEETKKDKIIIKNIIILIVSAVVIAFASNLLIDNGIIIAKKLSVPESVIAITIVALGTSLPEFTTAITSLVKKHSNLSLGNIIGANFFNVVIVSGISIAVAPFDLPNEKIFMGHNSSLIIDIPLAFLVMLILCLPPLIKQKTYRMQGILLIILYILYVIYQFS